MPERNRFLITFTAVTGALTLGAALTACGSSSADTADSGKPSTEVTVYSADGLHSDAGDGFYDKVFKDFTAKTGIKVNYVEGGSGEMVQRLVREKSNTKADLIVTLPPFIQQADGKGLLTAYKLLRLPSRSPRRQGRHREVDVRRQQLPLLHLQHQRTPRAAQDLERSARGEVQEQAAVLHPRHRGRRNRRGRQGDARLRRPGTGHGLSEEAPGQQCRPVRLHRPASPRRSTRANSWSPTATCR